MTSREVWFSDAISSSWRSSRRCSASTASHTARSVCSGPVVFSGSSRRALMLRSSGSLRGRSRDLDVVLVLAGLHLIDAAVGVEVLPRALALPGHVETCALELAVVVPLAPFAGREAVLVGDLRLDLAVRVPHRGRPLRFPGDVGRLGLG